MDRCRNRGGRRAGSAPRPRRWAKPESLGRVSEVRHSRGCAGSQAPCDPGGPSRGDTGAPHGEMHVPRERAVASGGREKSGRTFGKGMLTVLPLRGLEKPLEEGEAEPQERSPSDARFFSGRGGCPGRGGPAPCRTGLWWPLCPGDTVRKLWGRKPLSTATAAALGVPRGWGAPWELASGAPGSSPGGRPVPTELPTGALLKPRKAWLPGGHRASGGSASDSEWLCREAWRSAGRRRGRPGPGLSWNSPVLRRLPEGRLLPSGAIVGLGLVSAHWSSADRGLLGRQTSQSRPKAARE